MERDRVWGIAATCLLLLTACYDCGSASERGMTIANGAGVHCSAETSSATAVGAGLYAGAAGPNIDVLVTGCPVPTYAGVPPSHEPNQLEMLAGCCALPT